VAVGGTGVALGMNGRGVKVGVLVGVGVLVCVAVGTGVSVGVAVGSSVRVALLVGASAVTTVSTASLVLLPVANSTQATTSPIRVTTPRTNTSVRFINMFLPLIGARQQYTAIPIE